MSRIVLALLIVLFALPARAERCALIDSTDVILQWGNWDAECPPDPTGKDWDWRPAPVVAPPAVNDTTQVLVGPTYTVQPTQVLEGWTVRDKTAPELAADKAEADAARAEEQARTGLLSFTSSVTIGSVAGATFTDKTFTVTGLLVGDVVASVMFTAGLTPATIGYFPMRVSAADTLVVRFFKIASGAVTPPASQSMTVLVLRP